MTIPSANDAAEPGLRMLSLDGGGIRGLSELIIVEEIMERIKWKKGLKETPRPSEYFDLIGGTSTGGLIAILFGRLNMSAAEAISAYEDLAGYVFSEKKPKGKDGTFKATRLETAIKKTVAQKLGENKAEAKMYAPEDGHGACKAFVCAVPTADVTVRSGPALFRTYRVAENNEYNCTIWEAARATSAAPTFFKRVSIGPPKSASTFVDAGLGYNNPVKQVIAEAERVYGPSKAVACIVSIGTGQSGNVGYGEPDAFQKWLPTKLIEALAKMATNSEITAEEMSMRFKDSPDIYFRLDVDRGLHGVALNEWEKLGDVRRLTQDYMWLQDVTSSINKLVDVLISGQKRSVTTGQIVRLNVIVTDGRFEFEVPYTYNIRRFVPRPDLQSAIDDQLNGSRPRRCVLLGMGGIGKTELALRTAEEFRKSCHVFWIDYRDESSIYQKYISVGTALSLSPATSSVVETRRALGGRDDWLLIFDNIDDESILTLITSEMLPTSNNGRVLFTGRLSTMQRLRQPIEIWEMTNAQGESLLRSCCPRLKDPKRLAISLIQRLGRLPLALEQAASYICMFTEGSPEEYLEQFEAAENHMDLLQEAPASRYSDQLLVTWNVTFQKIGEDEKLVFNALAALRPDGVEEGFLKQGAISNPAAQWSATSSIPNFERGVRLPERYAAVLSLATRLRSAINNLGRLSMIRRYNKKYTMHPLVQLWAKERLEETYRQDQPLLSLYLTTNNLASMSDVDFVSDGDFRHYARVCVENLSRNAKTMAEPPAEVIGKACFYLARTYWLMHETATARMFFEQAKSSSETAFGLSNLWTLWIYNNLGLLYREENMYGQACMYFEKAAAGMASLFGESGSETVMVRRNLSQTKALAIQVDTHPPQATPEASGSKNRASRQTCQSHTTLHVLHIGYGSADE